MSTHRSAWKDTEMERARKKAESEHERLEWWAAEGPREEGLTERGRRGPGQRAGSPERRGKGTVGTPSRT